MKTKGLSFVGWNLKMIHNTTFIPLFRLGKREKEACSCNESSRPATPASVSVTSRPVLSFDAIFISWTLRSGDWIRNVVYLTSSYQFKTCWEIPSSALNGRPQPSPGPAVIISSKSYQAGVLHSQNAQQFFRFQPRGQAMNSLFSDCHVGNVQVFMSNNSAGFHWT